MPLYSKLLLPVALGLSVVTVTAFVAYYIFKKEEEDKNEEVVKRSKVNVIEVSVPKSIVPAFIGRNGSHIKTIESKTGALLHFKKFSDKEYDVCIIRGRKEATQLAEAIVHEFIKQQPVIEEDTMLVPSWACGRIIGTAGDCINDISHRSGARIKLESSPADDNNTQRQISFRGTKEQIRVAKDLIETCIAQEKCRREIEQSKRPPRVTIPPPAAPQPQESPGRPAPKHAKYKPEATSSSIEVYVSAVSSPSRFWVQFVGPQVAQLDDLVAQMTEYYGNKEKRSAHALKQVCVGQVVAAVFRHDGRWYRARVHDIRPNEFDATQQVADVFFLDYGDSEYVATHELCELRADLLRLRFQAMECFLAGVKPAGGANRWHSQAIERFEELTQVARWKPLLSKTCTYKKSIALVGEKEKEIPGIKLFDVTEEGSIDVGEALVTEGWAEVSTSPRPSPPPVGHQPNTPFGDLGNSRVLGMLPSIRSSSLPKDHKDDRSEQDNRPELVKELTPISPSKSLSSGLETTDKLKSVSNFDLSYSEFGKPSQLNGSHEEFLSMERSNLDKEMDPAGSVPSTPSLKSRDELKANMNRIDSHHSNLEALGRLQH